MSKLVPIVNLWPQKTHQELRVRSDSSRKLAKQKVRDYTTANEATSQSVTKGFGPLNYLAAGLQCTFPKVPSGITRDQNIATASHSH